MLRLLGSGFPMDETWDAVLPAPARPLGTGARAPQDRGRAGASSSSRPRQRVRAAATSGAAHARGPAIQQEDDAARRRPRRSRRRARWRTRRRPRRAENPCRRTRRTRRSRTPTSPSPTIMPEASSTPSCLVASGSRAALGALVEIPADDRADHDHQRALRRQVDAEAHRERRKMRRLRHAAQHFVDDDQHDADAHRRCGSGSSRRCSG